MEHVHPGDAVITAELSRMRWSLRRLLQLSAHFESVGVDLISSRTDIGTRNAAGRFLLSAVGVISQMECVLKQDRILDKKGW
jgi:DNA invertase Pin-like site-specific DNA recombinase